ncbi:MAG: exopolysaccharide biosynthesis polyprenyl glycosylphosphotransferase [Verrucomicrobiaceae bacterium]|nr:exopolysaccharide biosynthesis polyprenyl glycosylphosphotransferase [Verrucomicrobiaceae bacterium]
MISDRYYGAIRLHQLLKLAGGSLLFWGTVWGLHLAVYEGDLLPANYLWASFLVPGAAVFEFLIRERSSRSLVGLSRAQIWEVTQREVLFVLVALFGVMVMSKDDHLSRVFLAAFFLLYSTWVAWMNLVGHRLLHRRLFQRSPHRGNTLVLAPSGEIERDEALHMRGAVPGAEVLGYVSYGGGAVATMPTFPVLGDFENIREICRTCHAKLLLALGLEAKPELIRSLQQLCDSLGMRLIWVDDHESHFPGNLDAHQSGSRLFLTNWREPLEDPLNRAAKRAFDLVFSLVVTMFILPPLCLCVWLLHRVFSPGPLFYRQARTGRQGEIFEVYKFRSMHLNTTPGQQARAGDPRFFPGAALLRKTSLDEMPQFLNVLHGEMSVVGPRPHFVDHDEQFSGIVEDYPVRHFAKPGITGLAQVKGCRVETDTDQKVRQRVRLDHFYLRRWSLFLDLCIVADTVFQIVFPPKSAR